jgi:hypothetical protein
LRFQQCPPTHASKQEVWSDLKFPAIKVSKWLRPLKYTVILLLSLEMARFQSIESIFSS